MAEAAFPCAVFLLRRHGERLPNAEVMARHPARGALICIDRYGSSKWYVRLFLSGGD